MKEVKYIIYRYVTTDEFFCMYKRTDAESGGGGQKYIDFPTGAISIQKWEEFFDNVVGLEVTTVTNGPKWKFPIFSIGLHQTEPQSLEIFQRREASVSITRQHIHTRGSNRIHAWNPEGGFPANQDYPAQMENREPVPHGLLVFLIRTADNEIWAGWCQNTEANSNQPIELLSGMMDRQNIEGDAGFVNADNKELKFDETNGSGNLPFLSELTTSISSNDSALQLESVEDIDITDQQQFDAQIREENYRVEDNISLSKTRAGQKVFADRVKKNYDNKCAICDISTKSFLVGSHIIPWRDNKDTRLDPRNGICLCVFHDKAFDKGYISFSDNLEILIKEQIEDVVLVEQLENLNGEKLREPTREKPKQEYLDYHRNSYNFND